MATEPLATVWIASYNHAKFLPTAIESVLGQTYPNVELVIVDDGSTDGSDKIAERYARDAENIRVFSHPGRENRGVSATLNRAFAESRGTYLSGLPSDDVLYPDKLERQIAMLASRPDIAFVFGYVDRIDESGRVIGHRGEGTEGMADPLETLILKNYIPGMAVMWQRQAFERAGAWIESLVYSDWEFSIRQLAHFGIGFVDEPPVAQQRAHRRSTTLGQARGDQELRRALELYRILDRSAAEIGGRLLEPRLRALIALQRSWYAAQIGLMDESVDAIAVAFDLDESLAADVGYVLGWFTPRWSAGTQTSGDTGEAVSFGRWFAQSLTQSRSTQGTAAAKAVARRTTALELAIRTNDARPSPTVLRAALGHLRHDPALLRDAEFIRTLGRASGLRGVRNLIQGIR